MKSPNRAKKQTSGISFYFVLYTVAIITVFVITMERDQLLKQRDEDLAHLVQVYIKPLQLAASVDTARFFVGAGQALTAESLAVRVLADGPIDKKDILYSLVDAVRILPNGSATSLFAISTGMACWSVRRCRKAHISSTWPATKNGFCPTARR
jgi:hypothetical protein